MAAYGGSPKSSTNSKARNGVLAFRTIGTTDMSFWQISGPLLAMGLGLPFFFVPVTTIALASVDENETASAAGLMNFLRTLAGAVATSIVNTSWENGAQEKHAQLAGLADPTGETLRTLGAAGINGEQSLDVLDRMVQGQSVMIATNELMMYASLAFLFSAMLIWLAPRPTRSIALGAAH
jgi:DHA2 family multidrug resistance protein